MPFEPKPDAGRNHRDAAPGDDACADLPDDLSYLADQHAADAARLESVFPARPLPATFEIALIATQRASEAPKSKGRAPFLASQLAAAVLLVAGTWLGMRAWQGAGRPASSGGHFADDGVLGAGNVPVSRAAHLDRRTGPSIQRVERDARSRRHEWFSDLNSSDQEAVLDTLEENDERNEVDERNENGISL